MKALSGTVLRAGGPKLAVLRLANPIATGIAAVPLAGPGGVAALFVANTVATGSRTIPRAGFRVLAKFQLATPVTAGTVVGTVLRVLVGVAVTIPTAANS